MLLKAEMQG